MNAYGIVTKIAKSSKDIYFLRLYDYEKKKHLDISTKSKSLTFDGHTFRVGDKLSMEVQPIGKFFTLNRLRKFYGNESGITFGLVTNVVFELTGFKCENYQALIKSLFSKMPDYYTQADKNYVTCYGVEDIQASHAKAGQALTLVTRKSADESMSEFKTVDELSDKLIVEATELLKELLELEKSLTSGE